MEDFKKIPDGAVVIDGRPYLNIEKIPGLPKEVQVIEGIPFVDINTFKEFQNLYTPPGWYWCEFYGGTKEYRCFLIADTLRRAEFFQMDKYNRLLDSSVRPIYQHGGLYVRQDPSHAMPGFYIVSPDKGFRSTDDLALNQYLQMRFLDYEIGQAMNQLFGIQKIFRANEERKVSYQNVHTWLLPIDELAPEKSINEWNTLEYMIRFSSWRTYKDVIVRYNELLERHLETAKLRERADRFQSYLLKFLDALDRVSLTSERNDEMDDHCIFSNNGILVEQDSAAGIPGFYAIKNTTAISRQYSNEAAIAYFRMRFIDYRVRTAMRDVLKIEHAYKLHEDIGQGPHNAPVRIMPIIDIDKYNRIYHFTISEYMKEHDSWQNNAATIQFYNQEMRRHLKKLNLKSEDDLFRSILGEYFGL